MIWVNNVFLSRNSSDHKLLNYFSIVIRYSKTWSFSITMKGWMGLALKLGSTASEFIKLLSLWRDPFLIFSRSFEFAYSFYFSRTIFGLSRLFIRHMTNLSVVRIIGTTWEAKNELSEIISAIFCCNVWGNYYLFHVWKF